MREWLEGKNIEGDARVDANVLVLYPTALETFLVMVTHNSNGDFSVMAFKKDQFWDKDKRAVMDADLVWGDQVKREGAVGQVVEPVNKFLSGNSNAFVNSSRNIMQSISSPVSDFFDTDEWLGLQGFLSEKKVGIGLILDEWKAEERRLKLRLIAGDGESYIKTSWARQKA